MRRRTNPWIAYSDLFSALLVATFAGFMVLSAAYRHMLGRYEEVEKEMTKVRQEANSVVTQIQQALNQGNALGSRVRSCGEDTCIDLYIHFDENQDVIKDSEELSSLENSCSALRSAIDQLPLERKKDIEIIIEGHTDSQQPSANDARERFLFNWNLSGKRATSMLYQFQRCGLVPPEYQIVAIGYADSMPICRENNKGCLDRNRRTTLRLRADTKRIEERLNKPVTVAPISNPTISPQ
jgi:outer membrane protein OmpA-like peptidoglycan-associated protein